MNLQIKASVLKDQQFIDVIVQDMSSNEICQFYVKKNIKLSQLREYIEKQWNLKNFKFLSGDKLQAIASQNNKPFRLIMQNSIVKIQRLGHFKNIKQLQQNNKLNDNQLQEFKSNEINKKDSQKLKINPIEQNKIVEQINQEIEGQLLMVLNKKVDLKCSLSVQVFVEKAIKQISLRFRKNHQTGLYSVRDKVFRGRKFDINQFIKFDWKIIEELNFCSLNANGQLNDQGWNILVKNADKFSNIKKIYLGNNKITTVKGSDLLQFKKLQHISFGSAYNANPLSDETKLELRNFVKKNPKISVYFQSKN